MSAGWVFNSAVSALLLPPFDLILLCAFGLYLRRRRPRCGLGLSLASLLLLAALATYPGAMLFIAPLEKMNAPPASADMADAQAIVVLGGGRLGAAPEYDGQDVPSASSLQRIRYAARLQRATKLPLLVSGGQPDGATVSEAAIMARSLREDFGVPVQWLEQQSNNTAQNARFSARILQQAGIRKILLVTDALHMQRAKTVFMQAGLEVTPAPTVFLSAAAPTVADYFPRAQWLQRASYAMHEWLGLAWYGLRHRLPVTG